MLPPDNVMFWNNYCFRSISDLLILLTICWCIPSISRPIIWGLNMISGVHILTSPILITHPSGNSYYFYLASFFYRSYISYWKSRATLQHFSLMSFAISFSDVDSNEIPSSYKCFYIYSVRSLPARFIHCIAWLIE